VTISLAWEKCYRGDKIMTTDTQVVLSLTTGSHTYDIVLQVCGNKNNVILESVGWVHTFSILSLRLRQLTTQLIVIRHGTSRQNLLRHTWTLKYRLGHTVSCRLLLPSPVPIVTTT